LSQALARGWHGRGPAPVRLLLFLLVPFGLLFRLLVAVRRQFYRLGFFRVTRLPVPVIVVGNLTVGGSGKTPLTLALVAWLCRAGYSPGLVSRGYGGSAREAMPVRPDSDPAVVGDEPVLLARRAGCPVWIGRERGLAGRSLLASHPEVDVILADDGLQHLALARDMEIVVVDGRRGFGNGRLLPAGPLREPLSRLAEVDAVVVNGDAAGLRFPVPVFSMALAGRAFVNLARPDLVVPPEHFLGGRVHVLAGIGDPQRFFDRLVELGLDIEPHPFPDHHAFTARDLPAGTLVMTEKDAVKCAAFARPDAWFLAVDAEVDGGLNTLLLSVVKARHGSQTA
jgi:tetraacyldisaccharide 4'-kinase